MSEEEATILHADVDSFFASVAQRDDPRLRGRPTIVGGGVVLAASYEAKAFGISGGMGGARARRLCPHAEVVQPSWPAYVEASRALFDVFAETAPVVEGLSMEEAFMDVRGLERISGSPIAIAGRLRREVRARVGLPISVGVARTKTLAKMASRMAKPDGLLAVPPHGEEAFLHPIAVEKLWGVGPATAEKLHAKGIRTAGELAAVNREALVSILGRASGRHLHAVARNRDPRRVRSGRGRRSIGSQSALGRAAISREGIDAVLLSVVDRVTRRMRAGGRAGRTVTLRLRFGDYSRATRSHTLPQATAATRAILAAAKGLLEAAMPMIKRRGLTLVGIAVSNLSYAGAGVQLELPFERDRAALDAALDEIRNRFGTGAITRASLLRRGERASAHLLPGDQSPSAATPGSL